jgi:hypothetical protein
LARDGNLSLRINKAFCVGVKGKPHERTEMIPWTSHSIKCPKCGNILTPEMVKNDLKRDPNSWKTT